MFADDIKLYASFSERDSAFVHSRMSSALSSLSTYLQSRQLSLSVSKCVVLHLGNRNPKLQYSLNNQLLSPVDTVKDLGVLIDRSLTFNAHYQATYKKGLSLIFRIFRSFSCTQSAPFIHAYKTYVLPVIEYASPVWSPHKLTHIRTLEKLQHVFTRLLLFRCSSHTRLSMPTYSQRLILCNLHSLQHRRAVNDILFAVNILSLKCNLNCSLFWLFRPTRGRLSYFSLSVIKPNSNLLLHSFAHRTCSYLSILFKLGIRMENITRHSLLARSDLLSTLRIPS